MEEARIGDSQFLIRPKLLSSNVKRLNEGDKCLRVRNLLRKWKANIVCFQEIMLEFMSCNVVRSLWGCHHVD